MEQSSLNRPTRRCAGVRRIRSASGAGSARGRSRLLRPSVVVLTVVLSGCGYGQIQELEEQVRAARQEIEIQLQRRAELVPNLLETLQANSDPGDELVRSVADARSDLVLAIQSGDLGQIETANEKLCSGLQRMLEAATGDVALRTAPAFELLRSQLDATEEQVERASREYNEAVRRFNAFIEEFPQLITARVIGAAKLEPFELAGTSPKSASSTE